MTLNAGGASWNPTSGIVPSLFPVAAVRESAPRLDGLESILVEFGERWRRGESPRAEDFVSRLGRCDPADVVELIYHEFCLAESSDFPPDPTVYLARFPEYGDRLARLFGLRDALGSSRLDALAHPEDWPEEGGEIGPYTLVRTLGQGSFARVFLAEQNDLERRLLVVKVANRPSPEPRLLARAQHAHIVEVLRHGETSDGQLHLICMPFLGGATLAEILAERARRGGRSRSGRDFLTDLDRISAPEYPEANLERPAREILSRLSYPKAVAWIVARLAEALDHSHSRGVTHGDLKPSNVLLAADGRPMLFDFNLAVDWGDTEARDDGGGTLAYMAPERLAAIAEPGRATPPRPSDRHRADIYALGLVLLESLTGVRPDVPDGQGMLPRDLAASMAGLRSEPGYFTKGAPRSIPRGLRVILDHCLAVVPVERYRRASELAEDLDRFRCDLPPIHVDEPPIVPRVARWARRQRLAIAAGLLVVSAGTIAAVLASSSYSATLHDQANAKLDDFWNGHEPGIFRFRLYGQTFGDDPGDPVEVAERHLARYGVLDEDDWRTRDDVRYLDPADRAELEVWLAEQAWRLAHALGERRDSPKDLRRGIQTLERVLTWAPFRPLRREADRLRAQLQLTASPSVDDPSPASWQECYLEGVSSEVDDPSRALEFYNRALQTRPNSFWLNYRAAVAETLNGDSSEALKSLSRCIARRPQNAPLRVHRAGLLLDLDSDAALTECNVALSLDPDLAWAYFTRASIQRSKGNIANGLSDLGRFRKLARDPASINGTTLKTLALFGDHVSDAVEGGRKYRMPTAGVAEREGTAMLLASANEWAAMGNLREALETFDRALQRSPDSFRVRLNRLIVLRQLNRPEGREELDELIGHPDFTDALDENSGILFLLQHESLEELAEGRIESAIDLAQRGLMESNRLHVYQAEANYYLSRIYAIRMKKQPSYRHKALTYLSAALHHRPELIAHWTTQDAAFDDLRPDVERLINGGLKGKSPEAPDAPKPENRHPHAL